MEKPKKGILNLFIFGIVMTIITWLVGAFFGDISKADGMILGLISLLTLLQVSYAWLYFNNYFLEEE